MQKIYDYYNSGNSLQCLLNTDFIENIFLMANEEFCIRFLKWTEFLSKSNKFAGIFEYVL